MNQDRAKENIIVHDSLHRWEWAIVPEWFRLDSFFLLLFSRHLSECLAINHGTQFMNSVRFGRRGERVVSRIYLLKGGGLSFGRVCSYSTSNNILYGKFYEHIQHIPPASSLWNSFPQIFYRTGQLTGEFLDRVLTLP